MTAALEAVARLAGGGDVAVEQVEQALAHRRFGLAGFGLGFFGGFGGLFGGGFLPVIRSHKLTEPQRQAC